MAVTIESISLRFGEKQVLQNLSYEFKEGFTCVFAPSGRGKTTLLNVIAGLLTSDCGKVDLNGKKLAAVFQTDRLLENLSAVSNVRLVCPQKTNGEIESALCAARLGGSLYQPAKTLSGGMKRRVALVRALESDFDVLLLDEPFAGLDSATAGEMLSLIKARAAGKTVIWADHNEAIAEQLGAAVLRL